MFAPLLIGAALSAAVQPSPTVLVRGDIVEARPIETEPAGDEATIGGPVRIRVRVREVLIGALARREREVVAVVPMASLPASRRARDIYLLVERDGPSWRGVNWDRAASGICVTDGYARDRGVAREVEKLRARGVVACG